MSGGWHLKKVSVSEGLCLFVKRLIYNTSGNVFSEFFTQPSAAIFVDS